MKIILLGLCLVGTSCAALLRRPRKAGFGSKSEEMMQFGPYAYMNSPQLSQLAPLYYNYRPSYPQLFPQPLQRFYLWPQQTPTHQAAARPPQRKSQQTPVARQPIPRPQLRPKMPQQPHKPVQQKPHPRIQQPMKKPPAPNPSPTHHQGPVPQSKGVKPQQPQILFPNQQLPWHFPQFFGRGGFHPQLFDPYHGRMPAGFGRPPVSNEEGTPYYGYGYHGLGGRVPYNSEEFEQDFETPKEKEAPKTESPAADPTTNATDSNSTLSNPPSQAGNATNSGLSMSDNGTSSPNLESRLLLGNGIPTLAPTPHILKSDAGVQNGMDQSINTAGSPNNNHVIQNLPSETQQSAGHGLQVYKHYPGVDESPYSTHIFRGDPSGHPEDPMYPSGYGQNSIQRGNGHPEHSMYPSGYGQNSIQRGNGHPENPSYPSGYGQNSIQRGNSHPENSMYPSGYGQNSIQRGNSHPENSMYPSGYGQNSIQRGNGHPENPTYPSGYEQNSIQKGNLQNINNNPSLYSRPSSYGQEEHPHYPERNPSDQRQILTFPSSDPQSEWNKDPVYRDNGLNSSPPEAHFMDPQLNTLGQAENSYNIRKDTDQFQPSGMHQLSSLSPQGVFSPTKRTLSEAKTPQYRWKGQVFNPPVNEREQFPSLQHHVGNKQEDLQVFQDDTPRYNSRYNLGSSGQRGRIFYPEKSSYDLPPRSFHPETWEGRENSPTRGPAGQREQPVYSPALPSNQMQRNSYRRSDSFAQQETPWVREKHLLDLDREYRNSPDSPTQQHTYPKYLPENPSHQRRVVPHTEIHPWSPEHSPPYAPEHLRQTENIPYQRNQAFRPRERSFQNEGSNSPPQSTIPVQGGSQYSERGMWVPQRAEPSFQKEASPYFNSYSPDFRRKPTYMEDTGGADNSNINAAERRHYPDRMGYSDDYPREHRTITSYQPANRLCCAGDSPVPRENFLAPLRSAPQVKRGSWEQRQSLPYPEAEGSPTHHASRTLYPSGMQSSQKTEKSPPNQRGNLGVFGEDLTRLGQAPPCSSSQLSQQSGHEVNHETGLVPTKNTPCYGRSIRGDGHSILERIVYPKRDPGRAAAVKLVPEKVLLAQEIKSAALGNEDERNGQRAELGFKRIPCLGNRLNQYLSSTVAPSDDPQPDLFYEENPMLIGKSFFLPPEPHPLSSTNPSDGTEEKPLTPSSPGEDLADQPNERTSDCLLFQK